jgi:hypothetical protein
MSPINSTNELEPVRSESERYLTLLEKRLSLLESLSTTIRSARADFIALDLDAIHTRLREQERFCAQIRALDGDITQAQLRCAKLAGLPAATNEICWPAATQVNPALSNKIKDTMRRVASAQAQLKRVNDAHQCLLRKSRRNVQVLVNLFQAYAPGYSVEATRGTGTLCEERV